MTSAGNAVIRGRRKTFSPRRVTAAHKERESETVEPKQRNFLRENMIRTNETARMMSEWAARVVAILALVVVAGCGGGDGEQEAATDTTTPATPTQTQITTTPPPPVPGVFTITIENREYSHLAVPAGTQVNVVNRDDVEHSVTSDAPGLFDVHVQPHSEEVFTAPGDPGTYPYHCVYHPAMHGELVVD